MSNKGLEFATALKIKGIVYALKYGKSHLDNATYKEVIESLKKLIKHSLLWILIAAVVGCIIAAVSYYIFRTNEKELLDANEATHWETGVRADAATVQYTRGESYRYDVTGLGINLDSDFPGQSSLILLLDDSNQLHAVFSKSRFDRMRYLFVMGIVFGGISAIAVIMGYYTYIRRNSLYAKKWYAFLNWVNTMDESFLTIIRAN